MSRIIYRFLIACHPPSFRENHGDEMLCIFSERTPREIRPLLADALFSLLRQWTLHSGAWKFLAGGAVSALLVLGCGYPISRSFNWSLIWGSQRHADRLALPGEPPDPAFNEYEFELQARQAVQLLDRYGRSGEDSRPTHRRPNAPSPNVSSGSNSGNRE
jgi:hypothetical protein